ncbi:hypothetical protein [Pontibacillus halophilus]|uniref:hypothetical protein n=1 Tax=Pontibacillus halophilus TaxID=516704 RepID=UPI00047E08E8|nr:hypothetical protein [Pontibacillus halophilus]
MGYQETYFTVEPGEKLTPLLEFLTYNHNRVNATHAFPVAIIDFKKDICGKGSDSIAFHSGQRAIYVVGERSGSRDICEMLYESHPDLNLRMKYTEDVDSTTVFMGFKDYVDGCKHSNSEVGVFKNKYVEIKPFDKYQ